MRKKHKCVHISISKNALKRTKTSFLDMDENYSAHIPYIKFGNTFFQKVNF